MQGGKRSIEFDSESYNENLVKYLSDDDYHEDRDSKSVDFDLKLVPLKASPAVVRVDCFLDDERQDCWVNCSGTVISCVKGDDDDDDDVWVATVLTCTTFITDPDVSVMF